MYIDLLHWQDIGVISMPLVEASWLVQDCHDTFAPASSIICIAPAQSWWHCRGSIASPWSFLSGRASADSREYKTISDILVEYVICGHSHILFRVLRSSKNWKPLKQLPQDSTLMLWRLSIDAVWQHVDVLFKSYLYFSKKSVFKVNLCCRDWHSFQLPLMQHPVANSKRPSSL